MTANPQPSGVDPRALESINRLLHGSEHMPPEVRAQLEAKVKELQDNLIARHAPVTHRS